MYLNYCLTDISYLKCQFRPGRTYTDQGKINPTTVAAMARAWEDQLTDEQYIQHFGYIRRPPIGGDKTENNIPSRQDKLYSIDNKQPINASNERKNGLDADKLNPHVQKNNTKHENFVQKSVKMRDEEIMKNPTPPTQPKTSKSSHSHRQVWIDPMKIDYNLHATRKVPFVPKTKESVPETSKPTENKTASNNDSQDVEDPASKSIKSKSFAKNLKRPRTDAYTLPSRPLEWSKRFGNEGRAVKKERLRIRMKIAQAPPPPRIEELLTIINLTIRKVLTSFYEAIQRLTCQSVSIDIKEAIRLLHQSNQTVLDEAKMNQLDTIQLDKCQDKRYIAMLTRKKWLECHRQRSTDQSTESETIDHKASLVHILSILSCVPNIRQVESVAQIISWLIPKDEKTFTLYQSHIDSLLALFSSEMKAYQQSLLIIASKQSDRSTVADAIDRCKESSDAASSLREWYNQTSIDLSRDHANNIYNDDGSIVSNSSVHSAVHRRKSFEPFSAGNTIATEKSTALSSLHVGSAWNIKRDNTTQILPLKPIAARKIEPVGRRKSFFQLSEILKEELGEILLPPSIQRHLDENGIFVDIKENIKASLQNVPVYQNMAREKYLKAIGWPDITTSHIQSTLDRTKPPKFIMIDNYDVSYNLQDDYDHDSNDEGLETKDLSWRMNSVSTLKNSPSTIASITVNGLNLYSIKKISDKQREICLLSVAADIAQGLLVSLLQDSE